MALMSERDRTYVQDLFQKELTGPVTVHVFTVAAPALALPGRPACDYCAETQALLEELAELNDKIRIQVHDSDAEPDLAARMGVDKLPALVLEGEAAGTVRFFGIPAGYEFRGLIEDLIEVGSGQHGLSAKTLEVVAALPGPVHLQVFVTPTCPYCVSAARLAHKLAIASPNVTADVVEANEFPELSERHGVSGVPHIVINDVHHVVGARPEAAFVAEVRKAFVGQPAGVA